MRAPVKRTLTSCKICGNSEGGQCNCEKMLMRDGVMMVKNTSRYEGPFYQAFTHIARQFMDIRSHLALLATCQHFYQLYRNSEDLSLSANHFAFSTPLKAEFRHELGWHRNPVVVTCGSVILKLIDGVLSKCVFGQELVKPTVVDSNMNDGFRALTLPDGIQGRIAGLITSNSRFLIWTATNEIYMTDSSGNFSKIAALSDRILKILPGNPVAVITNRTQDNVIQISLEPPYTCTSHTSSNNYVDIAFPSKHASFVLTDKGEILVSGRISENYAPHIAAGNYPMKKIVLTDITTKERIIGIASGNNYLVAWSNNNVFVIGKTHPYFNDRFVDFSNITLPKNTGEIVQVKAGRDCILLLTHQGEVYSAGFNYAKQLARKTSCKFFRESDFDHEFKKIEGLPSTIVSIAASTDEYGQSAFLSYDGRVFLCGTRQSAFSYYHVPETSGTVAGFA